MTDPDPTGAKFLCCLLVVSVPGLAFGAIILLGISKCSH